MFLARQIRIGQSARNLILYTLLFDDTQGTFSESLWNIYHHRYFDDRSRRLLEEQTIKLLSLSRDFSTWNDSPYGSRKCHDAARKECEQDREAIQEAEMASSMSL